MTNLEAANRALALLGVAPIGSLNDATQAARCMSALIDGTKKAVLCEFPWAFALRIVPLTPATGSVSGYDYAFVRPSDALEVRRVYRTGGKDPMEFRVVGSLIGANESAGEIEYVADLGDWPPPMAECFVTRLACDAAMTLTGAAGIAQMLYQKYTVMASHAAEVSSVEEQPPITRAAGFRDYVYTRE